MSTNVLIIFLKNLVSNKILFIDLDILLKYNYIEVRDNIQLKESAYVTYKKN